MWANSLSLLRIALLPFLLYSLWRDGDSSSWPTLGLLLLAGATDAADGYVARRLGQTSELGKVLDPVADKLLLGSLGVALVCWRGFPAWLAALLIARDAAILLAGLLLWRSRGLVIPASRLGKCTTACMVLAVLSYVAPAPASLREALVWAAAALILASSIGYVRLLYNVYERRSP
jgi:CDP-diacylglycerol--glycerol-3-phosphate 3-phosphatidyltransferase